MTNAIQDGQEQNTLELHEVAQVLLMLITRMTLYFTPVMVIFSYKVQLNLFREGLG